MNTVVGDPLYRPFAVSNEERIKDFESRFKRLSEEEKLALAWAYRLKTRQIFYSGKQQEAIALANKQATRLQQRPLWEGLANLYLLVNDNERATEAMKTAKDSK